MSLLSITRNFFTVTAALTMAGLLTASASANIFFDDFDTNAPGAGGTVTDHMANTGQTWAGGFFGTPSALLSSDHAQGGLGTATNSAATGGNGGSGNYVYITTPGATLSPDTYYFEADMHRTAGVGAMGETAVALGDLPGTNAGGIVVNWWNTAGCTNSGATACLKLEGVGAVGQPSVGYDIPVATGSIHVQYKFNLSTNTGELSWNEIGSSQSGSIPSAAFVGTITADLDGIWTNLNQNGGGSSKTGLDNIYLGTVPYVVPEPASLGLLGLGGLMMLIGRRRRQR